MLEMGRILKSKPSPLRVKIKTIVYRLSPALTEMSYLQYIQLASIWVSNHNNAQNVPHESAFSQPKALDRTLT